MSHELHFSLKIKWLRDSFQHLKTQRIRHKTLLNRKMDNVFITDDINIVGASEVWSRHHCLTFHPLVQLLHFSRSLLYRLYVCHTYFVVFTYINFSVLLQAIRKFSEKFKYGTLYRLYLAHMREHRHISIFIILQKFQIPEKCKTLIKFSLLLNKFRILFDQTFNILSYHSMNISLSFFQWFWIDFKGWQKYSHQWLKLKSM